MLPLLILLYAGAPQAGRDRSLTRIESGADLNRQGKLWAVGVGISKYKQVPPRAQLNYAHRDAASAILSARVHSAAWVHLRG